jgi:NADH:ubiquinone oxidoreductase subunit K
MSGPYLYDDDPAPLHTGTPRNRNWSIVVLMGLTVLLAIGTVVGMVAFRGSPTDEAEEVAGVFVAALAAGDDETASGLLCEDLRPDDRIATDALDPYRGSGAGTVGDPQEEQTDGGPVMVVPVRYDDGTSAELVLIPEGGPKVCGLR